MRKETISISERTLMFSIGGQLFSQAPNRQPRKAEIIMTKVRDAFRKEAHNDNEYYTLLVEEKELKKYIKDLLFAIPEFKELNLSQINFEKKVSVDDESLPKYSFSSAYDKHDSESWRRDFIDLDAFVGNVIGNIYMVDDSETDCFCCIHGDGEKCKTCIINPDYKINYEGSRQPKGKFTFACKHDCYRSRYICCEECGDKDCGKRCASSSQNCGLAINRLKPVVCTNNDNWFGTIGKEYLVRDVVQKEYLARYIVPKDLNDIRDDNDIIKWEAYSVIDDKGQLVDIPSKFFESCKCNSEKED